MNLNQINNVYFIGIGGIGMSALARYFNYIGKKVAGYNKTPGTITDQLINEGIEVHFDVNIEKIKKEFNDIKHTLIVYTPAVPDDFEEILYFKEKGFVLHKRSEILGLLTHDKKTIAVSGTHGKTTTTTLTAHILNQRNEKVSAFLGGISKNYNTNLLVSEKSDIMVTEADEYDRSFLHLTPYIAVVTAMDADHLDIYGTRDEMVGAYNQFISQIRKNGFLIYNKKYENDLNKKPAASFSYSLNEKADFYPYNIRILNNRFCFDLHTPDKEITNIELGIPGRINIENSVAAMACALLSGVNEDLLKRAVKTFNGVQRRFDYHLNTDKIVLIDDYAHHPKELEACITSIKEIYHDKKVTGIFQPHLYSRTLDFYLEFAQSLDLLDEIILIDIYPAREEPIEGVSSKLIFDNLKNSNKMLCNKTNLIDCILSKHQEVIVTIGAGDIDRMVEPLKKALIRKYNLL